MMSPGKKRQTEHALDPDNLRGSRLRPLLGSPAALKGEELMSARPV